MKNLNRKGKAIVTLVAIIEVILTIYFVIVLVGILFLMEISSPLWQVVGAFVACAIYLGQLYWIYSYISNNDRLHDLGYDQLPMLRQALRKGNITKLVSLDPTLIGSAAAAKCVNDMVSNHRISQKFQSLIERGNSQELLQLFECDDTWAAGIHEVLRQELKDGSQSLVAEWIQTAPPEQGIKAIKAITEDEHLAKVWPVIAKQNIGTTTIVDSLSYIYRTMHHKDHALLLEILNYDKTVPDKLQTYQALDAVDDDALWALTTQTTDTNQLLSIYNALKDKKEPFLLEILQNASNLAPGHIANLVPWYDLLTTKSEQLMLKWIPFSFPDENVFVELCDRLTDESYPSLFEILRATRNRATISNLLAWYDKLPVTDDTLLVEWAGACSNSSDLLTQLCDRLTGKYESAPLVILLNAHDPATVRELLPTYDKLAIKEDGVLLKWATDCGQDPDDLRHLNLHILTDNHLDIVAKLYSRLADKEDAALPRLLHSARDSQTILRVLPFYDILPSKDDDLLLEWSKACSDDFSLLTSLYRRLQITNAAIFDGVERTISNAVNIAEVEGNYYSIEQLLIENPDLALDQKIEFFRKLPNHSPSIAQDIYDISIQCPVRKPSADAQWSTDSQRFHDLVANLRRDPLATTIFLPYLSSLRDYELVNNGEDYSYDATYAIPDFSDGFTDYTEHAQHGDHSDYVVGFPRMERYHLKLQPTQG